MIFRRLPALFAVTACILTSLVACKSETKVGPTTYVTVTPQASTSASTSVSSPTAPAKSSAPAPVAMTRLPGRCDNLLSLASITDKIGHSIPGPTAFIVGLPDSSSGRVSYINCRYGVSGQSRALEIQVSLYHTAAQAAARIQPTVSDFSDHSATATKTTVSAIPATVLQGGTGNGYGPTIILAYGQRTVAVTFASGAVPAASVAKDLNAVTALAVKRTSVH